MARLIAGLVFLAIGGYLLVDALSAVQRIMAYGSGLSDALFEPPTGIIRVVGTALIVIGGVLYLSKSHGKIIVSGLGVLVFAILPGLMAAAGADSSMWGDEAMWLVPLIVSFFAMVAFRNK